MNSIERREKYAAAMYRLDYGTLPDGGTWRGTKYDYLQRADVVVAVADEELTAAVLVGSVVQAEQTTRLQEENAALRESIDFTAHSEFCMAEDCITCDIGWGTA